MALVFARRYLTVSSELCDVITIMCLNFNLIPALMFTSVASVLSLYDSIVYRQHCLYNEYNEFVLHE